ncbi:MAG: hypothetical protein K2M06_03365 [Muribaculaceae bacterium]|nr:hypothetical protein [Muribaculaceae bacterium]
MSGADRIKTFIRRIVDLGQSRYGKDALMFMIFLAVSTILWFVMSLSDEEQFDMRLPMQITHVPDSVTLISPGPEALSVSLTAHGTQMLKLQLGSTPTVNVDFRAYRTKGRLLLSSADLKALVRSATDGSQVAVVSPDSINIPYTTHPGYRLPLRLDSKVTTGPNASIIGRPRISSDSVRVFFAGGKALPQGLRYVSTEPLRLTDVGSSFTRRVRVQAPAGARVIPDSVDVSYDVEPLIIKHRKVVIEPVNVPSGVKLITFPAQIDVYYMVPMSLYATTNPRFRVQADYKLVSPSSKKLRLRLSDVPDELVNVHLSADSAEYIIER